MRYTVFLTRAIIAGEYQHKTLTQARVNAPTRLDALHAAQTVILRRNHEQDRYELAQGAARVEYVAFDAFRTDRQRDADASAVELTFSVTP